MKGPCSRREHFWSRSPSADIVLARIRVHLIVVGVQTERVKQSGSSIHEADVTKQPLRRQNATNAESRQIVAGDPGPNGTNETWPSCQGLSATYDIQPTIGMIQDDCGRREMR